ncbi:Putative pleiotropic drug resistance protein 7 [Apostasia shenzhenica]|uniref:Pleiotropic drug resistance protein 7 n=1 Tax=Apostasia shenzhenica TaxID=1088818 RepID=A0A2I0AE57_9ASPA|nr:Putative pleiotropic drug resistance protein 7 [Apostasia shenzhenica]
MNEFVPQRISAYIGQHDLHIAEMTVRETLAFSARCQGVGYRYDMLVELSKRELEANIKPEADIDMFMKILGLENCADIIVGDQMIRGISGGQKKRLTTGEMLVGPARALFMDEISTGLDSSTTFSVVNSIRQFIHILGGTAMISLLQPAPETYNLFDDIVLLSEGQIVYQGPRAKVLEFFESMCFKCPERKGVADFLLEVTSRKDQRQYWVGGDESYRFVTVSEFSNAFLSFCVGYELQQKLCTPFDKSKNHPATLTTRRFGISNMELIKACFSREFLLMKRNSIIYIFKLLFIVLTSITAMAIFFRGKMHHGSPDDGIIYMGALFVGILTHQYNAYTELAMSMTKLPVFYKHRDLLFFPAWVYAVPTWILKIPVSFLECALYTAMTYYVFGFSPNIQRFFRQFFIFSLLSQVACGLFRVVAAIGRDMTVANSFGSFVELIIVVLGGFVISRENIQKFWIWGYWASPLMYAQNALAVNEFLGKKWQYVTGASTSNKTVGLLFLESRGLFPQAKWFWIGAVALIGYILLFNIIYTIALTFLNPIGKGQAFISEKIMNKKSNRTVALDHSARETGFLLSQEADSTKKTGIVLPFEPLSLTFDNVKYSVEMPAEMKAQGFKEDRLELLKGVSGSFRPGILTALMGVSGAGKTTLMDVLAGRKTSGYIEGKINISGYQKKQETFTRISGYCEQNDIHSPHVTIYESLVYSAWLRLPFEVDASMRKMFIEEVLELIELTPLRKALVGLPGVNGLSTEQRKRLTIAVELVANPSIIFMDEPTTGLDARAAAIVMRTVRKTVETGRTVVCTIHQPSIDIFEAFDELFLMKRGGEEIYFGPLGHNSSSLIKYFEEIKGVNKITNGYNPATWMLEITNTTQEETLGVNFTKIYRNSDLFRRNRALISELSTPAPGSKDLYFPTKYSQPFFSQCLACFWKQYKSYWRNSLYCAIRIFFTTIISCILGTVFWRLGSKIRTKQDLYNSIGSMYAATLFIGMQNAQTIQPVVDVERTVFYREKSAGMYSPLSYAFAQVAIEIPYTLLQSITYGAIVYIMIDFQWTMAKFCWYILFTFCTFLYFTYYGMMAVSLTPNSEITEVVAGVFYGIWNLFAGFIVPRPRMPIWCRWYFWVCPVYWTLYGLIASQYGDVDELMEDSQLPVKIFIEDFFGYKHDFLGVVAAVEIALPILFASIFAFAIQKFNFQKR